MIFRIDTYLVHTILALLIFDNLSPIINLSVMAYAMKISFLPLIFLISLDAIPIQIDPTSNQLIPQGILRINLNGENGVSDLYVGVPVVIGSAGIEKVVELDLDEEEKKFFNTSIEAVSELFEAAKNIDPALK